MSLRDKDKYEILVALPVLGRSNVGWADDGEFSMLARTKLLRPRARFASFCGLRAHACGLKCAP
jgi:hypothetical protein